MVLVFILLGESADQKFFVEVAPLHVIMSVIEK